MAALRPCSMLLLLVLACMSVGTGADYAIETFKRQYIDYPWTVKTQDPKYCDMIMKERGFTRQKSHVFFHAAYETILAACISHGVKQTGFCITGNDVVATLCVAGKDLPGGSYDDYKREVLLQREAVYCDNGVPLYPLAPFYDIKKPRKQPSWWGLMFLLLEAAWMRTVMEARATFPPSKAEGSRAQ